jgi:hypothetical protein
MKNLINLTLLPPASAPLIVVVVVIMMTSLQTPNERATENGGWSECNVNIRPKERSAQ